MNLFASTLPQLQRLCLDEGLPSYVASQLCHWLYRKQARTFSEITNLSLALRQRFSEAHSIQVSDPVASQTSVDGTKKYLFDLDPLNPLDPHRFVEAVFIPDRDRATLCVSCQRGCKMGCRFCVTGQQGFHGSLTPSQILSQILAIPEFPLLTNIVFMGMGEPMDNLDAILATTEILTAPWGLAWSPRRITVSSVGITPAIQQFLCLSQCHLAISLHSPYPSERLSIMPMEKPYPIADTLQLLRQYDWSGQRRLSFEYIMFRYLNDDITHAAQLVLLLKGLNCRVNLIRFHSSPQSPYQTSTPDAIQRFQLYLTRHGITCTLRASRGEDIMAACGLLAGSQQQKTD